MLKSILFLFLFQSLTYSFEIHAHRGGSSVYAENSLAAIVEAVEKGVDAVEFDIHLSKDKVFFLAHDPLLDDKKCVFENTTLERSFVINRLDSSFLDQTFCSQSTDVEKERLTRLEKVLELAKSYPELKLNIEVKHYDSLLPSELSEIDGVIAYQSEEEIAARLNQLIVDHGLESRVIIQSFSAKFLSFVKKYNSNLLTSYLYRGKLKKMTLAGLLALLSKSTCEEICWKPDFKSLVSTMKRYKFDYVAANFKQLSHIFYRKKYKKYVMPAQEKGLFKVLVWTVNKEKKMEKAMTIYKVDGIITDKPELLLQ